MSVHANELKKYARELILSRAKDVEYLTIFERAEGWNEGNGILDSDADTVDELIASAKVEVSW